MTEDRARILRMVSEGTISPEEGTELLEAVEPPRELDRMATTAAPSHSLQPTRVTHGRTLVFEIEADGETKVNLRVPLGLAFNNRFMPRRAQQYLDEHGIDLQALVAEFTGASDSKGTLLEIEDGEDRVFIGVR